MLYLDRLKKILVLLVLCTGTFVVAREQPNIVIILADDMGYSDLGVYGGEIRTPVLDGLAVQGRQFTQFYNTARCCPSRASLLTGLYPHQAGIGHLIYKTTHPGYGDHLSADSITVAEALKGAGYGTYMTGKWHLAPRTYDPVTDVEHWPTHRGFDQFYGTIAGSGSFWDPSTLCRNETLITPENDPEYRPESFYYTDAITDNALTFLSQHQSARGEKPFFLYMAYTAAHWPLHAPAEAIREYEGQYDAGYAATHAARVARLRVLGLIPEVAEVADPVGEWEAVENREVETALMETYAAMVTRMDAGIGKVVDFLRQSGQLDNTLIFFLQDNGACAEDWFNMKSGRVKPYEPMGPNELQTRYRPVQTRDGRPVQLGPDVMPGGPDTFAAYKENWANVSNTPFRKYKHYVHEGGISSPLIVHWPERIKADTANRLVREPAHLIDIMATCLDAAQVAPPLDRQGVSLQPLEGTSLIPVLTGSGQLERSSPLFWEHEGNRAVRDGKWKLVALDAEPWELYDLSTDRGEMEDLAAVYPRIAARMAGDWQAWAARAKVLPVGGWMDLDDGANSLDLKQGESLAATESPQLSGNDISMAVRILQGPLEGVLLAQGSETNGYALYFHDDTLQLLMRNAGKLSSMELEGLPAPPFTIRASISASGRATMGIDDRRIDGRLGEAFLTNPAEGLCVGHDSGASVGNYPPDAAFEGRMGFVNVRGVVSAD